MPQLIIEGINKTINISRNIVTIGRHNSNDIMLDDQMISRHHAEIRREKLCYVLYDTGSVNGSFVNGKFVTRRELNDNDYIKLGNTLLIFRGDIQDVIRRIPKGDYDYTGTIVIPPTVSPPQKRLSALYEIGKEVYSILNLNLLLEKAMDKIFEVMPVYRGFILIKEEQTEGLIPYLIRKREKDDEKIIVSNTIIEQVLHEAVAVLVPDAQEDVRYSDKVSVVLHNIRSVMCAPLISKGEVAPLPEVAPRAEVIGLIYVDNPLTANSFSKDDLEFFTSICGQISIAIENAYLYSNLEDLFLATIKSLASAIDEKDPYTHGHSKRVADYSLAIANQLKLSDKDVNSIQLAATVHDVGKIGIPEAILCKKEGLTEAEWLVIREHPTKGVHILRPIKEIGISIPEKKIHLLSPIDVMKEIIPGVEYHHERYDGGGYPEGLKQEEIPLMARIIAVADAFDAITSDRPYREAKTIEKAIGELEKNKGKQHDPAVVDVFLKVLKHIKHKDELLR